MKKQTNKRLPQTQQKRLSQLNAVLNQQKAMMHYLRHHHYKVRIIKKILSRLPDWVFLLFLPWKSQCNNHSAKAQLVTFAWKLLDNQVIFSICCGKEIGQHYYFNIVKKVKKNKSTCQAWRQYWQFIFHTTLILLLIPIWPQSPQHNKLNTH